MKQKAKILIFCTIFVGGNAFCQNSTQIKPLQPPVSFVKKPLNTTFLQSVVAHKSVKPVSLISANYYATNLGFFCQQEIKLEKTTKIPFKFRLGSVQQCDWMEGKSNSLYYKQ